MRSSISTQIKAVFQDHALPNGTWEVAGKRVKPQDIKKTALLTVEGELDDISGSGQTRSAHALCAGIPKESETHYEVAGAGHYGTSLAAVGAKRCTQKLNPLFKSINLENINLVLLIK
jgi:poly(3-hydroxybutyrate) depolymerase